MYAYMTAVVVHMSELGEAALLLRSCVGALSVLGEAALLLRFLWGLVGSCLHSRVWVAGCERHSNARGWAATL